MENLAHPGLVDDRDIEFELAAAEIAALDRRPIAEQTGNAACKPGAARAGTMVRGSRR